MADIFDEVEEDLRADRARQLLRRYGGVLVAAAVLVVVAAGGWQAWQWYENRRNAAVAQDYLAAMQIADTKGDARQGALGGFTTVIEKAGPGYRSLARLQSAALKAAAGDLAGASALWDAVANDGAADPLLRDVANLQWATHQLDTGDAAAVASRLALLAAPTNPFHALAQEAQAMLDLRLGKTDSARATLKLLAQDVTAPTGVRRRADGMLERLGG